MPKKIIRKKVPKRPVVTVGDLNNSQRTALRTRLKNAGVNLTGVMMNKTPVSKLNSLIRSKKK